MNQYLDRNNIVPYVADNGTIGATIGATVPLYRAAEPCEIITPYFVNFGTSIAGAVATNYMAFSLLNGGTAGTALTSISSTVSSSVTAGWTQRSPVAIIMNTSKLAAGEWLVGKLDHVGSGLLTLPYVSFEVIRCGYET